MAGADIEFLFSCSAGRLTSSRWDSWDVELNTSRVFPNLPVIIIILFII